MTNAVAAAAKTKTDVVDLKTKERPTGFALVESIAFCGKELASVTIPRDADSIVAARLEPDCSAVAISTGQRADGLLIRKKNMNLNTRIEAIEQHFIPFANIRGLAYGE
jgi:hypothetical protein